MFDGFTRVSDKLSDGSEYMAKLESSAISELCVRSGDAPGKLPGTHGVQPVPRGAGIVRAKIVPFYWMVAFV